MHNNERTRQKRTIVLFQLPNSRNILHELFLILVQKHQGTTIRRNIYRPGYFGAWFDVRLNTHKGRQGSNQVVAGGRLDNALRKGHKINALAKKLVMVNLRMSRIQLRGTWMTTMTTKNHSGAMYSPVN